MLRTPTRMRHLCFAVVTVVCAACASDGESSDPATGVRPSSMLDMDVQRGAIDVGMRSGAHRGLLDGMVSDLFMIIPMDAAPRVADSALRVADTAPLDGAIVDAVIRLPDLSQNPADPFAGRPLGQCRLDTDCPNGPNGQSCSRRLPGGACLGCGLNEHCPQGTTCQFGTCIAECEGAEDCAPGLRCLNSGRCAAMPCVDGRCPVTLFSCDASQRCTRSICEAQVDCPAATRCVEGVCVEQRAL